VVKGTFTSSAQRVYEFGPFRLDPNRHRLFRGEELVPLSPKAIETLILLVENQGKLLKRETLMEALWPDTIVEDANLTVAVSQLRKAINQNCDKGEFIQTIPRVGYRFIGEVTSREEQGVRLRPLSDQGSQISIATDDTNGTGSEYKEGLPHQSQEAVASGKHGRIYWRHVGIAAASIVVLTAIGWLLRERLVLPSMRAPEKSIAVLPFENLSEEKANAFFADGVQDELLTDLSRIADLKVISRASVMHYKSGMTRDLREIGQQLGVANVLEGSVQRSGSRVRVNAQLLDARTDRHLWAQTYDRDLADVFAIESELAQTIADQLRAKLSPAERREIERAPTSDITAFDLYAHGKNLASRLGTITGNERTNTVQAVELLNQALSRDPSFFDAYCQLAQIHDGLYVLGYDHTSARLALADAAVEAASHLRPDAGETHLARAQNLYQGYLDYAGALAELELARQTLPNDSRVFLWKGLIERRQGHWEESTGNLERAIELDPRNVFLLDQTAQSYQALRRHAEEKATYDRIFALEPDDPVVKVTHALIELNSKADTRPAHEMIDSIRATNPAATSRIADAWLLCSLAEHNAAAAKNALVALGENPINLASVDNTRFNRLFIEGVIARMTQDDQTAQLAFTAARAEQEKIVQAQANYGLPLCVLGLIDAGLGRKEEALREGERAVELVPPEKDAVDGSAAIKYLAMIAAWVGDKDLAFEQLATAVHTPSGLTYGQLKLLPFWDQLRGDSRFAQLLEQAKKPIEAR
jgi:TolB-like protein/DNA-binding winged helix-turn-helix (wHTH) protein